MIDYKPKINLCTENYSKGHFSMLLILTTLTSPQRLPPAYAGGDVGASYSECLNVSA